MVVEPRAYDANRNTHSPDDALAALAAQQHGVVARAQLRALGLGRDAVRRRVERKRLHALYPGVYAVGHTALTADSRRMAAVLACGPGALLSYRAAGSAQGLLRSPAQLEVTVPRPRKRRPGILLHRSRLVHVEERSTVRGIPVTSVARTLVDLADVLDEARLAKAVHEAEVQRVFDLKAIDRSLARLAGRTGRHRLRRVLEAYQPEPHLLRSDGERWFKRLCEDHSLPQPQFNMWIEGCEVDAYWPDEELVVEIDGGRAHHTKRAFHTDRARDRQLATHGIQVVRVSDFRDEAALAAELRAIRTARGSSTVA